MDYLISNSDELCQNDVPCMSTWNRLKYRPALDGAPEFISKPNYKSLQFETFNSNLEQSVRPTSLNTSTHPNQEIPEIINSNQYITTSHNLVFKVIFIIFVTFVIISILKTIG